MNALLRARLDASGWNCEGTSMQNLGARIGVTAAGDPVTTKDDFTLERANPFATANLIAIIWRALRVSWPLQKPRLTLRRVVDEAWCWSCL